MTTTDPKPDFLPEDTVPFLAGLAINARDKNWSNSKSRSEAQKLRDAIAATVAAKVQPLVDELSGLRSEAVVLPFDARDQIEKALLDKHAPNHVGQAAVVMRLLMSWRPEPSVPRHVIYLDASGARWKDLGDGRVLLIQYKLEYAPNAVPADKATVEQAFGPLVPEVPASPEAGA